VVQCVKAVAMEQMVNAMATDNLRHEKIQKMSTIDWPSKQQHIHTIMALQAC